MTSQQKKPEHDMQDLRLIGVHEDGEHLLLAGEDGAVFRVPLTEELVQAARMPRPRVGQRFFDISGEIRPREVQTMIRAGLTAQEVAQRSGWDIEKVRKYEGPVLAERDHVAAMARQVRLRPRGGSHGSAPTLVARVSERLTQRDVPTEDLIWDSWRSTDGRWAVVLTFVAGGRQRQATWSFDPAGSHVHPADDEARWLSEDEKSGLTGPIPETPLAPPADPSAHADSAVYDVEAEGGLSQATTPGSPPAETDGGSRRPVDLMAAMRERSGARGRGRTTRRRQSETPACEHDATAQDDASKAQDEDEHGPAQSSEPSTRSAATEMTPQQHVSAEPAQDVSDPGDEPHESAAVRPLAETIELPFDEPVADLPPAQDDATDTDADTDDTAGITTEKDTDRSPADIVAEESTAEPQTPSQEKPKSRKGRASVPSWDDIMFGARRGE